MADFFVDLSAGSAGSGTSGAPWNSFTLLAGLVTGDIVWVRRAAGTATSNAIQLTLSLTSNVPGTVTIQGWPLSGDPLYSQRPAALQAAWDGDAPTVATLTWTPTAATAVSMVSISYAATPATVVVQFRRIKLVQNITFAANTGIWNLFLMSINAGSVFAADDCWFETNRTGATSGGGDAIFNNTAGQGFVCNRTTFKITSDGAGSVNRYILTTAFVTTTTLPVLFNTCTFSLTGELTAFYSSTTPAGWAVWNACTWVNNTARTVGTNLFNGLFCNADSTGTYLPVLIAPTFTSVASSGLANCNHLQLGITAANATGCHVLRATATGFNYLEIHGACDIHFASYTQGALPASGTANITCLNAGAKVTMDSTVTLAGATVDVLTGSVTATNNLATGSRIIFRNSTLGTGTITIKGNSEVYQTTIGGVLGTWRRDSWEGTVQSSSVVRTGGETFSLTLAPSGNAATPYVGLCTARPGRDTIWLALNAGNNTITFYAAYKGYTGASRATVWVETEYPSIGPVRACATSKTTAATALTTDGSTWTGDSGLTVVSVALAVTASQACVVPARFCIGGLGGAGTFYVDPKPVRS